MTHRSLVSAVRAVLLAMEEGVTVTLFDCATLRTRVDLGLVRHLSDSKGTLAWSGVRYCFDTVSPREWLQMCTSLPLKGLVKTLAKLSLKQLRKVMGPHQPAARGCEPKPTRRSASVGLGRVRRSALPQGGPGL